MYILLFDCSLDLDILISENKILYWLYFLQTQVGNDIRCLFLKTNILGELTINKNKIISVVLLGTKIDELEKKFNIEDRHLKVKQRMIEIDNSKKYFLIFILFFYFLFLFYILILSYYFKN